MSISGAVRETLQVIAEGVVEFAGFDMAAVSLVEDGNLYTAAVAGDPTSAAELMNMTTPWSAVAAELEVAESWGRVRFVPHERYQGHLFDYEWVPEMDQVDGADAWHPMDLLVALLSDSDGSVRGLLSMDLPRSGRRPDAEQRRIIELYARQAEHAVVTALERGDFERGMAAERAVADYRGRLIDVLSHELTSSVAAVSMAAELIRFSEGDDAQISTGLEVIDQGAARITGVVANMKHLARLGRDEDLEFKEVDLAALVREACSLHGVEAEMRGISIQASVPESLSVEGDAEHLAQMVGNIVSNAVKYSDDDGTVSVSLVRESSEVSDPIVVLTVADEGIGIPTDHLPHLFDEFYRSDTDATRQREGTGLGLSIVDRVVQRLGGSVTVESTVGEGTTFRVELPDVGRDGA